MQRPDDSSIDMNEAADVAADEQSGEAMEAESQQPAPASAAGESRELADQREKYLRLAAEYDNYRKRSSRERAEAEARGQATLIKMLLDPLDDLSRFADVDPASVDAATVTQGADMVERKLHKVLSGVGLEQIDPIDQPFDPALHEAVTTEPAASAEEDHRVSRVFQVGYRHNGVLLRPARVVVKQWNG